MIVDEIGNINVFSSSKRLDWLDNTTTIIDAAAAADVILVCIRKESIKI